MTREEQMNLITVASVPSRSDKGKTYTVKLNPNDNNLSCDCPGWIFSKREPRSCRHTIVFSAVADVLTDRTKAVSPDTPFRKLTNQEVDERNQDELGSRNPLLISPGPATSTSGSTGTRKARGAGKLGSTPSSLPPAASSKPSVAGVEIRTTIRTITFDDGDEED